MQNDMLDFKRSPGMSLGMEIELQLLNPDTLELVDGVLPLLELCPDQRFIQPEFNQATVEIASKICWDMHELEANIVDILRTLKAKCQTLGLTFCAAGTHPFCDRFATITPIERYLDQQRLCGYLADMMMTFALHIHVGMTSGDEVVQIMHQLKPYLPIFLALSASSPFWWGHDTGFASYRQRFLASMRSYGIPPSFKTWKEFAAFFAMARHANMYHIIRDIHWDIRPHPDLGTLEMRVMDAQPTVKESIMLATLLHALIVYLQHHYLEHTTGFLLTPRPWLIEKENYFRASQWGIDAHYIEDDQGNSRSIRNIVEDILETIAIIADKLGETEYLNLLEKRLDTGSSYIRQRRVWQETSSLKAVVASLVRELETDLL
jgi:carboxylate-amine ligase